MANVKVAMEYAAKMDREAITSLFHMTRGGDRMTEILRGHTEEIDLSELDIADLRCGIALQLKEIERLRKRLADAALVEAELREKCAELEAICKAASQEACTLGVELAATKADKELGRLGYPL